MLYTTAINDISWQEVVDFCEQKIPEGGYLDYKEDFPSTLEKTISALANTLGGIILIGVEEDDENKPVLPIKGINFHRGLSERVMNIILSNITPPLFPEIQICCNQDKKKAMVVIRVAQSHFAPHAISRNSKVYLRTGNRNKPEELAQIDDILWLTEKRRKSEKLRERLYSQAEEHFNNLYVRNLHNLSESVTVNGKAKIDAGLTLSICPAYPREPFCSPPELNTIIPKIIVRDHFKTSDVFPIAEHRLGTIVQNGVVLDLMKADYVFFTELNSFGLYFYRQKLSKRITVREQQVNAIGAPEIFARIEEFTDSALKFFYALGFFGPVHFSMHLSDILEIQLFPYPQEYPDEFFHSLDNEVIHSEILTVGDLEEKRFETGFRFVQRIAWTYGWEATSGMMQQWLKSHVR